MNIESALLAQIKEGFQSLFSYPIEEEISLQPTRKEFEGSYTFVLFPYLKYTKKSPEQAGQALGEYLLAHSPLVCGFNVVKGFLNLVLTDAVWLQAMSHLSQQHELGQLPAKHQKVVIEYSSPNTNKPLHLGHLRNNFLGMAMSRILEAAGYEVTKVNLVNDRGIHICKSMIAYQHYGQGETPESAGLKGDHLVGAYYVLFDKKYREEVKILQEQGLSEEEAKQKAPLMLAAQDMLRQWEEGHPETVALWRTMNGWVYAGFEGTYRTMGVSFDKYYYESDTYLLGKDMVQEGLEKGTLYRRPDGSVWCDLSDQGLDEKLLLRSDGTSVYMTQDLGTADLKFKDFGFDKSVYVVGNEQDYHFEVLFKILKKLGRSYAPGLYHLSYGMVDLPTGKMKSREGTVVDADDLMREMVETAAQHTRELGKIEGLGEEQAQELFRMLGMGALKYFLLKVDPKKRMLFNPQESIEFQGHTGPFIQYTHARIASILRKAELLGLEQGAPQELELAPVERDLVLMLTQVDAKIMEAAENYSPALLANYVFELAKEYNRFYAELPIFNENNQE
ncbi:MAG: arginine--tRNA ligase, partial [Cytophagales bacterium]|nr:arginine--tRNA ligase [Cytophagales bacterium]